MFITFWVELSSAYVVLRTFVVRFVDHKKSDWQIENLSLNNFEITVIANSYNFQKS